MLLKKTNRIWLAAVALLIIMATQILVLSGTTYAAAPGCYAANRSSITCPSGEPYASGVPAGTCYLAIDGAGTTFSTTDCAALTPAAPVQQDAAFAPNDCNESANLTKDNCGIIKYLLTFINILSALVGVVVVGSIIFGGIQYSSAGGDPQKVAAAKKRIMNALVALIAFIFMYAFLQYIVPGGVF